ncbi:MAG: 6-carboxytetrahydropterin synthase QueD [Waddliaceae bacterium]|nr:6-carboxytetrahydropterin synthase QueD [Waddliaceae bacterium]
MYELEKTFTFEAGHVLTHHDGKCSRPHGHSYGLTVTLRGNNLHKNGPKTNMLIDFSDVSSIVKQMIKDYLDHHWLNDTLKTDSPTAEFIAKWIFDFLNPLLDDLHCITLEETATSRVRYFG